jgi:long-chain acyl-CoA synthetase
MPQHSGYRESFSFAGELVDGGWSVMIFPEGRISPDGAIGVFRSGIGVLASQLGVPVIPARIDGLHELREMGRKFAPRGAITIRLGAPRSFSSKDQPDEIARALREAVRNLS